MRSELHETSHRSFAERRAEGESPRRSPRVGASRRAALEPRAVDAAFDAETAPQRGSRRDLIGAGDRTKRIVDEPHAAPPTGGAADDTVLSSLAAQLKLLQAQQEQISRLLEQAELYAIAAP